LRARLDAGDDIDGVMLEQACAALEATRSPAAAEAHARLTRVCWLKGDSQGARQHLDQATALVRDAADSPRKAVVVAELARYLMVTDNPDLALARQSVALAEQFGLDELRANALITLGTAIANQGDVSGMEILQQALDMSLANTFATAALRGYSNLGHCYEAHLADLHSVFRLADASFELARRQGSRSSVRWASGNLAMTCFQIGEWGRCDELVEKFLTDSAAEGGHYQDGQIRSVRAWLAAARGDHASARNDVTGALRHAEATADPQVSTTVRGICAGALALCGDFEQSTSIVNDQLELHGDRFRAAGATAVDTVMAADLAGDAGRAAEVVGRLRSPWGRIAADLGAGHYAEAADRLRTSGEMRLTALVHLRAGEQLVAVGRPGQARAHAHAAGDFFRSVGATALLRRAQELVPATA
jgi:hypothetical protein